MKPQFLGLVITFLVASFLLAGKESQAGGVQVLFSQEPVAQGEVFLLAVQGLEPGQEVECWWQDRPLGFITNGEGRAIALAGVDLRQAPGEYPLALKVFRPGAKEVEIRRRLRVVGKDYGVERLRLPRRMVDLDEPTLKRVRREQTLFSSLWGKTTPAAFWQGAFVRPVPGKVLAPFGRRRFINGQPRSPHTGVDFRAAAGEPVRAANRGQVALVGEFFFAGKAVVLDHGFGLYTMYFHLAAAKVKVGELVNKGQVIGLAGSSGRASGPHLHWGVRLAGARVDPMAMLRLTGASR